MLTNLVEIGHAVSINELGYSKKNSLIIEIEKSDVRYH